MVIDEENTERGCDGVSSPSSIENWDNEIRRAKEEVSGWSLYAKNIYLQLLFMTEATMKWGILYRFLDN